LRSGLSLFKCQVISLYRIPPAFFAGRHSKVGSARFFLCLYSREGRKLSLPELLSFFLIKQVKIDCRFFDRLQH